MRKLTNGQYFSFRKHEPGDWWQSWRTDEWFVITLVEPGEAIDEYGDVDSGWCHAMRKATAEELAERERQEAEWEALSPEERTGQTLDFLADTFPGLDWGT